MIYRKLGRTGVDISAVSLGAEHLEYAPFEVVDEVVNEALGYGVNYIDLFMASPGVRDNFGRVLKGKRDSVMLCGHIGACMVDSQYKRSRDPKLCETYYEDILRRTRSDYMDVSMIHYVDTLDDAERVMAEDGLLDLALRYKKEGKSRFVGVSSHSPSAALKLIGSGAIDVLMFSINPVHDVLGDASIDDMLSSEGTIYASIDKGINPLRDELFHVCERSGVAIVTMKTYCAGWLLNPNNNFGVTLTPEQCIHYALSRPGVAAVLPGCRSAEQVRQAMAYLTADDRARDYSEALNASRLWKKNSACMYCNHCLPCPVGIDVAETTRLRDLALLGMTDELRERYEALPVKASDCLFCGSCEGNCPFGIKVMGNIKEAAGLFE